MKMKILKKLVLLAITVHTLYTVTGCNMQSEGYGQAYNNNNVMQVQSNNTLGTMQLQNNTITEIESSDKAIHLPKLKSALNGYNKGYENALYDACIKWNADPYLAVNLIKFMSVDGTNLESHQANNIFAVGENGVLYKFNTKIEGIEFVVSRLQNSYVRWEHNLHTIEGVVDYLYPELEAFRDYNGTNERYGRIVTMLYRDYEALKGEKYSMRGGN